MAVDCVRPAVCLESPRLREVIIDLGYSSVSAFIEAFRKTFGVTPYRYFRDDGRARTV